MKQKMISASTEIDFNKKLNAHLEEAPEPSGEPMTMLRQMERWVGGDSVHNSERDECCPDFSCCHPGLIWTEEKRKKFAEAYIYEDYKTTENMSYEALGALLSKDVSEEKVYIVNGRS